VDEYGTDFVRQRQTSTCPLTLGLIVAFIDGSRHADLPGTLAVCYNEADNKPGA
jgi:hypothetical protein